VGPAKEGLKVKVGDQEAREELKAKVGDQEAKEELKAKVGDQEAREELKVKVDGQEVQEELKAKVDDPVKPGRAREGANRRRGKTKLFFKLTTSTLPEVRVFFVIGQHQNLKR